MPFAVGENVGPYRIMEQLGQGGMATVYKAYHAALDRYVALKVLHPAFNEDKTFEMRFQREARVVAKLEHPNIVPVYDYAEHERRPYLVMKFIEGETLKARIQRGPLSSQEIRQVVDSVGSALSYAHKQGILHRDIKPSNVLIATDEVMYLADFGLARIAEAGESTLSSDAIMGTPQYISPEQAMGKKDLDAGTDQYSFGVMLYELVVGQVPFNADTPFSIIHDHIYSPLPMPRAVNPKVPESVERVLLKTLSKERADRYSSVEVMIAAFKDAWDAAGVPMRGTAIPLPRSEARTVAPNAGPARTVDQPEKTEAAQKVPARKRGPWAFIAGLVVVLLCALVGLAAFRNGNLGLSRLKPKPTAVVPEVVPTRTPRKLPSQPPPGTPTALSPAVSAALDQVTKNPDDPNALLALSLAYWDAGARRQALETLNAAADKAPQDRKFFLKAALEFSSREAWAAASAMDLRAVRTYPLNGAPADLMDNLREAVYRAASDADIVTYLPFDSVERFNQPLGLVARGRSALYNGKLEEARLMLDQVKRLKPDFPEAILLEAEILIKEGRIDEARQLLTVLASDLGMSDWIRAEAEAILKTIP